MKVFFNTKIDKSLTEFDVNIDSATVPGIGDKFCFEFCELNPELYNIDPAVHRISGKVIDRNMHYSDYGLYEYTPSIFLIYIPTELVLQKTLNN